MKVREAILLLCVVFAPVVTEAQVPVRDNEKKKQWQSMENGPWGINEKFSIGVLSSYIKRRNLPTLLPADLCVLIILKIRYLLL